ncbi:MAG: peptidase M28 [Saprospirales bacterium]|nr:peptidase M28 [Saprospirales bacterium]
MRKFGYILLLFFFGNLANAQTGITFEVQDVLNKEELSEHLRYLASDELQGRRTASPGGQKAAEYIAAQFKAIGLLPAPGMDGYFQHIPFVRVKPAQSGEIELEETRYLVGDNFVQIRGGQAGIQAEAVFVGQGWVDEEQGYNDYEGLDVEGKVVIALPGTPDDTQPFQAFRATKQKREIAREKGALAIVELYRLRMPWRFVKRFLNSDRLEVGKASEYTDDLIHIWLKENEDAQLELKRGDVLPISLSTDGLKVDSTEAVNVVGFIPGADDSLKNEILLLTAHYDHVGVGKQGGGAYTEADSIFNGARDNAIGVVSLIAAAKELMARPPARTVAFVAFTGEEMGLLGSKYYADNPVFPLEQTVYNLNNDGAGYNSTAHYSMIGWGRTNADTLFVEAAKATGLEISKNPAENQNLFERSDNISFAQKGIPAVTFSPGFLEMDQEIMKYYHQVTDNPDTLDYDYLFKFWKAYARAAELLANTPMKLWWTPGDKFEPGNDE